MREEKRVASLSSVTDCGVYHLPSTDKDFLQSAASAAGIDFVACDFEENDDQVDALHLLAEALDLPDYFGGNLDALYDCLTDLSWRNNPATVLMITGCDELRDAEPEGFDSLLEVFAAVVDYWRAMNTPFWVLIDLRADGLANLPTFAIER